MKKLIQVILTISFTISAFILIAQNAPKEEILTLQTNDGTLEGTLTMPNTEGVHPLVFIIAGSGPTDRDCNSVLGIKTDAFKLIAEGLAVKNIATFRYDKRGVGKSTLTQKREDVSFDDFVDDAAKLLDSLKSTKRFSKIIVAGHSEGSLIGSILVQKTTCDRFISLSGANETIDSTLDKQIRKQSPPIADELKAALLKWKKGEEVDTVSKYIKQFINPLTKKFMLSILKYSPKKELSKVSIPVMVISGKNDVQVLYEDALIFSKFNARCTFKSFEQMTHVLKDGNKGEMSVYTNTNLPITEGLVQTMVDFIQQK